MARFADGKADRCENELRGVERKLTQARALMERLGEDDWEYGVHQREAIKLARKKKDLERELAELEEYAYA